MGVTDSSAPSGRPTGDAEELAGPLTIEQLAAAVGMSVRNVRAHQTRGLIPPPVRSGRTGRYDAGHVSRLRLIQTLQGLGFNLAAIQRIVADPGSFSQLLRTLGPKMTAAGEQPMAGTRAAEWQVLSETLVAGLRGVQADAPERLARAGLLRPRNGRFLSHPGLLCAASALDEHGLGVDVQLRVQLDVVHAAERAGLLLNDALAKVRSEDVADPSQNGPATVVPLVVTLATTSFELAIAEAVRRQLDPGQAAR
jgi:DNA-binding transcriptional MerR regulator